VGPGDDCAVVRAAGDRRHDWLLKSDPVIANVHFTADAPGQAIGHKALGRVLSDIAAMGGEPLWALVDLVAPARTPALLVEQIFQGLSRLARRVGLAVVGGDVSAGPVLEVHVLAIGRVAQGKAVLRSGARPGDSLFVTGALGGSLAGRHLRFQPRLAEGGWLARHGWARAMIDLSDGLATDLRHLIRRSGVGAELWLEAIPVSRAARKSGKPAAALRHALTDGEDFELLFAVPAAKTAAFMKAWRRRFRLACTRIGTITRWRGVIDLVDAQGKRRRLNERGYDHFHGR
jgi:thiamine-monophosphate kinase